VRSGRVASFEAAHLSEIAGAGDRLSHLGLHETGDERFEVSEDPQPGDRFEPRKWLYRGYAYEQDRQRSAAGCGARLAVRPRFLRQGVEEAGATLRPRNWRS